MQWSIKQVEEFYKQKIKLNSRKRIRSCLFDEDNDDNEDEDNNSKNTKDIKELKCEISHLTAKLMYMENTNNALKKNNKILSVEKHKTKFELSLLKEELKQAKCLLDAAQKDLCHEEETKYYIEEIKSQLSFKKDHVQVIN